MTTDRQIEGAFRTLLDDDVTILPARVLDAVLAELPATRQTRRRWLAPSPGRLGSLRFGLAAVAMAVAIVIGVGLVGRPGGVGGPPATPSVVPSASSTASPSAVATPTPLASPTPSPGYGSAPPGWPSPAPLVPATPLADPSGSSLTADLVGRQYNIDPPATQDAQAQVLTLRAADDPHCTAMFGGRSTCFTILWTPNYPKHATDPAVRGPARIEGGALVLGFALVPNDPQCEGTSATYTISADGWTLQATGVPPCDFPRRFVRH
jgi:hypothetical protein